jgi:ATP-dependent exoDNAse (exonuclease V) alpha subunit
VANSKTEANSMLASSFVNSYIKTAKSLERDDLISTHTKAIGVYENKSRRLLNENVRRQLKEAGILKGEEHRVLVGAELIEGKREPQYLNLCRGEQIIFAKNANNIGKIGIFNGELGTILKVHKPNKDALAKLDILMHRADGSKEKVRLDLAELATNKQTGKYFFDKTQIEYGYAVTGHKVQGATKVETEVLLEKNTGFEIFNV